MRILIRRPHAYFFLGEQFKEEGGVASSNPLGCVLADGSQAPIPGIYLLDAEGAVTARVSLLGANARKDLLEALGGDN